MTSRFIQFLLALIDDIHHARERAVLRGFGQRLFGHQEPVAHGPRQAQAKRLRLFFDLLQRANYQLSRSGRSWRAQVGNEVNNGEVGLVADGRDDGNLRARDDPCQALMIKRSKVLG